MALTNKVVAGAGSAAFMTSTLIAILALAGCNQYWERRDTVTLGVGDAVAANKVTHTEDPWPRESQKKKYDANGERIRSAVERYKTNQEYPPEGLRSDGSAPESAASK